MIKCILIYLWIYIGLFYMIEAGDDDEHVHIKLHMSGGQRKRSHIQHHKKRHTASHHPQHHHRQHAHPQHHDSSHNYLTEITAQSSSSLLPPNAHTKKFPSSSPQNLHESGQLLNMEEELFGHGDVGGDSIVSVDANGGGDPMIIPSYLTKDFATFPQPTTTYETEIIPHNSEGFNVAGDTVYGLEDDLDEDNENEIAITSAAPAAGRGKGSLETIILGEQMKNYQRHKPPSSLSAKTIKNEQLLQQLLQQQHSNDQPEIMSVAAYKSTKLRANKYRPPSGYHSEDDMTEAMMYPSSAMDTRHNSAQSFNLQPTQDVFHSGSIKALTVDDIWSELQQQYLNKYTPQAQALTTSADSDEQLLTKTPTAKIKSKRKRNTKRQRHAKPTTTTAAATSWPTKSLSYSDNKHHNKHHLQPIKQQQQQQQQQQHYYDDIHFPPSAAAFSSSLPSHRDTDYFIRRPSFGKINAHNEEDDTAELDEEAVPETSGEAEDGDFDVYGDASFEDAVYQRGKKFTRHTAYGNQHSHANNPFSAHDLYGSHSTPVTATVATNIQPSTYHPKLITSTLPSLTSSTSTTTNSFLPPTSYQWRTQQNYPASYQTYHLQHQQQQQQQQQQPQWIAKEQYAEQYSPSTLRLPTTQLSPTQANEFAVSSSFTSSSSSSSPSLPSKDSVQPPARYKKRKNRIKPKRNRIVVI